MTGQAMRAVLTALGATDTEDRVYRFAATTPSTTCAEISAETGLSGDKVQTALDGLQERRLVSRTSDKPARYIASSPAIVEAMLADRLLEARHALEALDRLSAKRRARQLGGDMGDGFEVVRGQDALRHHALQLIRTARSEVVNMIKPPVIAVHSKERVLPPETARNRAIFETSALEAPGALDAIREGLRGNDEIRVRAEVPLKLLAADRAVALVPISQQDTTPVGVLIFPSAVLDGLLALFDYVWDSSVRLDIANGRTHPAGVDSVLSPEDRQLLSLLLAGLTDEAIAAHFRVSVRTVQRKVHALMEVANVRTRMQLAWEAARHDWLSSVNHVEHPAPPATVGVGPPLL
jgi:DNA-binding CsgD family transcriptional regulator/DNA-binding MarR family transcriptional regulator